MAKKLLLICIFMLALLCSMCGSKSSPPGKLEQKQITIQDNGSISEEIKNIYHDYKNRKNIEIKYYFTGELYSYDVKIEEYTKELTEKELSVIKINPIAFDGTLPAVYKKVFYERGKILWEEIYSWKGMLIRFYIYQKSEVKKVEQFFTPSDMQLFVEGKLLK